MPRYFNSVLINLLLLSQASIVLSDNYNVKVDHLTRSLHVNICYENAPDYLQTISRTAEKIVKNIQWNKKNINQYNGYINLPEGKSGCLSYSVDGRLQKGRLNNKKINQQHPYDTILEISDWLWINNTNYKSSKTTVTFNHDTGVNVSAPWPLISRTKNKTAYHITYTPETWMGYIGFGVFEITELTLKTSQLNLAIINGTNTYNKSKLIEWIEQMSASVAKISNGFPVKRTQVMVFLLSGSRSAVPWGQVNRLGGSGVLFIVNPNKSHKELMSDWTAAHEFSHLLLPYTPDDRWLSEGFASYYQNISRARSGLLDEKSTWEKLLAGFKRGEKTANRYNAPVLKNAKGRDRMQMYWGGAVIALKADVALYKQTKGQFTLARALEELGKCCLETPYAWTAENTFERLDKITNTQVFSNLYTESKTSSYPDYQNLLKELGIHQKTNGQITLDDKAPKANIRQKITNG